MKKRNTKRGFAGALFLDLAENYMDLKYGSRKRELFNDLPDQVVEIGPGPGANLRYYRSGTSLTAIEPNPVMHKRLAANARRLGIELEIRNMTGEAVDMEDNSVEAVVGTLVLCTVENPEKVASEIRRILKPGGRYIFLEHVAASPGAPLRHLQNLIHKPWHWLTDGCHLNRDTPATLMRAGFAAVEMDCFMMKSPLIPVMPHIFGLAVK